MSAWNDLIVGDSVTVRWKRTVRLTETVVVKQILPKTLADGYRFESSDARVFTRYLHDLANRTPDQVRT